MSGGRYAPKTSVDSAGSRAEIERALVKYGATGFGYGWDEGRATVAFKLGGRQVRFVITMPELADFRRTPKTNQWRSDEAMKAAWEQACRQRWRALVLIVKAKLEAIEIGISTVDSEFLASIVLPGGGTIGDRILPTIDAAYAGGSLPSLLPGGTSPLLLTGPVEVIDG